MLIITKSYNQIVISYLSYQKPISLIIQNYYWLKSKKIIKRYILNCYICKHIKASRIYYNGLLKFLLILSYFWTNIDLNFVTSLPINNNYNMILMIVDHLIKKKYYILNIINNNNTIIEVTIKLLFYHV